MAPYTQTKSCGTLAVLSGLSRNRRETEWLSCSGSNMRTVRRPTQRCSKRPCQNWRPGDTIPVKPERTLGVVGVRGRRRGKGPVPVVDTLAESHRRLRVTLRRLRRGVSSGVSARAFESPRPNEAKTEAESAAPSAPLSGNAPVSRTGPANGRSERHRSTSSPPRRSPLEPPGVPRASRPRQRWPSRMDEWEPQEEPPAPMPHTLGFRRPCAPA